MSLSKSSLAGKLGGSADTLGPRLSLDSDLTKFPVVSVPRSRSTSEYQSTQIGLSSRTKNDDIDKTVVTVSEILDEQQLKVTMIESSDEDIHGTATRLNRPSSLYGISHIVSSDAVVTLAFTEEQAALQMEVNCK